MLLVYLATNIYLDIPFFRRVFLTSSHLPVHSSMQAVIISIYPALIVVPVTLMRWKPLR